MDWTALNLVFQKENIQMTQKASVSVKAWGVKWLYPKERKTTTTNNKTKKQQPQTLCDLPTYCFTFFFHQKRQIGNEHSMECTRLLRAEMSPWIFVSSDRCNSSFGLHCCQGLDITQGSSLSSAETTFSVARKTVPRKRKPCVNRNQKTDRLAERLEDAHARSWSDGRQKGGPFVPTCLKRHKRCVSGNGTCEKWILLLVCIM